MMRPTTYVFGLSLLILATIVTKGVSQESRVQQDTYDADDLVLPRSAQYDNTQQQQQQQQQQYRQTTNTRAYNRVISKGQAESDQNLLRDKRDSGISYGRSYVPSTDTRDRGRGRNRNRNRGRGRNQKRGKSRQSSSSSSSSSSSVRGQDGLVRETVSYSTYGSPGSGVTNTSRTYSNIYQQPTGPTGTGTDSRSSTSTRRISNRRTSTTRTSSTRTQVGGRGVNREGVEESTGVPAIVDEPYFTGRSGQGEAGQNFFSWNGRTGTQRGRQRTQTSSTRTQTSSSPNTRTSITRTQTSSSPNTRTSSTRTQTTSTRTSNTRTRPGSSTRTTYSSIYPGGSSITTYRNTTTYSSRTPGSSSTSWTGLDDRNFGQTSTRRFETSSSSSGRSSSSSSSSSGRSSSSSGRGGSSRITGQDSGYGETYRQETEEPLGPYVEEEGFDEGHLRGPIISREDRLHPFVLRGFGSSPGYGRAPAHQCDEGSCYPDTGNLLIGRESRLSATSTCGLYRRAKYCIVSHLKERKKCFLCDSRPQYDGSPRFSHKIENIVYRYDPRTRSRSWWQSENGVEGVSMQLDLEAEFHFTHLVIVFRTFRPAAMLIERSHDYGRTWKVYRYFAYDCDEAWPGIPRAPATSISQVVCESRYSAVEPSDGGEVIFRVLPPNIPILNPYSDEVQNLLKITNLRINFTKLHTLGDQLLDSRKEIKEKYYYAISDMVVRGSCSCYGHASRCLPISGVEEVVDMVHGRCECTHNTKGRNCEQCEDFHNDLPWKPAVGTESNVCKRCNCNSHASLCHFDPQVYEASGNVTGGVCDDCIHNTQGRNCEECVPYYYQEPGRELYDPDICQPCNCDPQGSIDNAICDSRSDVAAGLVAGRCHCRPNVDGLKCDRCKAGFWNFTDENPNGCQACTCDLLGTVNNAGCNVLTGECACKRFVTGRDCNQCLPQHYGLSEHPDGCQPCNCDRGGASDNNCDVLTGQCKCRPHVTGRQCNIPEEGYYIASLNYLTYEAENARGSENCQVVMREPYRDGRQNTWTGLGFMRVFSGSYLEFEIELLERSMEYDMVINYEPQFQGTWDNVLVTVIRPGPIDPNGACANTRSTDDQMVINLPSNRRHVTLFPPVCLEAGKRYKVRIDFRRSNAHTDHPSASVLIDSIKLIPRAEKTEIYSGSHELDALRHELEQLQCSRNFYEGQSLETIPEQCTDKHLGSIGFYVYGQAFSCQCDGTGSYSSICSELGGQCDCKPNVAGRRCDRCAPGTYGFGPEGCKLCDCNPDGSLDNFCDQQTGQCKCRPNTYGRQCGECQPGYWNFQNCERCECNGHADTCDSYSGKCDECRDNTAGHNCAVCVEGFYGDPRLSVGIACRQCPCPGTADSGHSFADRCFLDSTTKDVVCECEQGYAGSRCDVCADNYYGNPEVPGGSCQPCDCSNNIDISRRGNCNPRTGECEQCLYSTSGFNCERCAPGYYGDALNQECRECVCNLLGTNQTIGVCDHVTGQCSCLPNVLGVECNRCEVNHWKIASGQGCEPCACDVVGSYSDQCNEFDGQCQCRPGFGGRRCDQCQTNHFGDPKVECLPCNCNREGSATYQCNHETGQCVCLDGIGGNKCDECARGFTGYAPRCNPCGECFDNWDFILNNLRGQTENLIARASEIKQVGATGAYSHEFESMKEKLDDVKDILLSANTTSQNLVFMTTLIKELNDNLTAAANDLQELEDNVDDTNQRISISTASLADLQVQAEELRNKAGDLKDKATELKEENVEGALDLTRQSGERSREAQKRVEFIIQVVVFESDRNRRRIENLLINIGDRFNRTREENEVKLIALNELLDDMDRGIPELNDQVCDRRGEPCDLFCGGAGCGKCGGLSCNEGLVNLAEMALDFAEDAEDVLKQKEALADELVRGVSGVKRQTDAAHDLARMAFEMTFEVNNRTEYYKTLISKILQEIDEYFSTDGAKPEEIKELAEQVLKVQISLRPEQITSLAESIATTIETLTNIEAIIDATRNELELAIRLKERADRAKLRADASLSVAERVASALEEAEAAQDAAEEAVMTATQDIQTTQTHLTQIASETNDAQAKANTSLLEVQELHSRVEDVKARYKVNQRHLDETTQAVNQATLKAQHAANDARTLEDKYTEVVEKLVAKAESAEAARRRAELLKKGAEKLAAEAFASLDILKEMEEAFETNERTLTNYESTIRRMEQSMVEYHTYILSKTEYYAVCQSGGR